MRKPLYILIGLLFSLVLAVLWSGSGRVAGAQPAALHPGDTNWPLAGTTTRISIAWDGTQADMDSYQPVISADGRFVAFASYATNLVPEDTDFLHNDVFVHDRLTGQTSLISVASDGTQGSLNSWGPSISGDGRYVAFHSEAGNLVPGDTNGYWDVFIHDRQTGQTSRVSVASDGTQGNGASDAPAIAANGCCIAFNSSAGNLVPGDTNDSKDIFVHDHLTGQTSRVSVASDGTQGDSLSWMPSISADGRYVAFHSAASNLVPQDTNSQLDVFVHDRQTGQTSLISVASDGTQGDGSSMGAIISADGRYVAFMSYAGNLVPNDTNGWHDAFLHDRHTGQTTRISVASDGTQANYISNPTAISADGRFVTFISHSDNLVPGDTNGLGVPDGFIHDRQTGQTILVTTAWDGGPANNDAKTTSMSADGRYVTIQALASNLVPDDTNFFSDVFVHDTTETYTVSGTVRDTNNQPMAGVLVYTTTGHTAITDAEGNYTMTGLVANNYTIIPIKPSYIFSPLTRSVTVPPAVGGQDYTGTVMLFSSAMFLPSVMNLPPE